MEGLRNLVAVYQARRAAVLEMARELDGAHYAIVSSLIDEADRRLSGDLDALGDKADVHSRINRTIAAVVEHVLVAYGMRGHASTESMAWLARRGDVAAVLQRARKPTRSARRLVASAVTYDDRLTVEILSSPESRVLLASLDVDLRAVQIAAVRALAAQVGSLPGVAFILAQESEDSLHELVVYAQFLTPIYP